MKVNAYLTDCCKKLSLEENVLGLVFEKDIFKGELYNVVAPDKSNIHFCLDCYSSHAPELAMREVKDRDKNEELYQHVLTHYATIFKKRVYTMAALRKNLPKKNYGKQAKKLARIK